MKKPWRMFRMGFAAAGVAAGIAAGLYAAYKKGLLPPGKETAPAEDEALAGGLQGIYVGRKTGEPLFLSSALVERTEKGMLCFTEPLNPNSVEYSVDLTGSVQRVGVAAPSDPEILGHVKERPDGSVVYEMDGEKIRFVPLEKEGRE